MSRPTLKNRTASKYMMLAAGIIFPAALLIYSADAAQVSKRRAKRPAPAAKAASVSYEKEIAPLVAKYCLGCHSGPSAASGVSLDKYKTLASVTKDRELWD